MEAEMFFVKKRRDAQRTLAYRPICLLPVLNKILKKLIKIAQCLTWKTITPHIQHSTGSERTDPRWVPSYRHTKIRKGRRRKRKLPCMSLTKTQEAFDNMSWDIIRSTSAQALIDINLLLRVLDHLKWSIRSLSLTVAIDYISK